MDQQLLNLLLLRQAILMIKEVLMNVATPGRGTPAATTCIRTMGVIVRINDMI
jgi:hypothetical protein